MSSKENNKRIFLILVWIVQFFILWFKEIFFLENYFSQIFVFHLFCFVLLARKSNTMKTTTTKMKPNPLFIKILYVFRIWKTFQFVFGCFWLFLLLLLLALLWCQNQLTSITEKQNKPIIWPIRATQLSGKHIEKFGNAKKTKQKFL